MENKELINALLQEYKKTRQFAKLSDEEFSFFWGMYSTAWAKLRNAKALHKMGWFMLTRYGMENETGLDMIKTAARLGHPQAQLDLFLRYTDFNQEPLYVTTSALEFLSASVKGRCKLAAKFYVVLAELNHIHAEQSILEIAKALKESE